MKKFLTTCALGALIALPAMAAPQSECAYSQRQTLVRDARDATQIADLIARGVIFDEKNPRCGGTLMQLAVRRGNPEVLKVLLEQDLNRASQIVPLDEFPIPGAPKKVPLWLFAAYYAPNENIIVLLHQALTQSRANIAMTDDFGRNVLWYMDRNPVLRRTALYDQLNELLLTSLSTEGNAANLLDAAASSIVPTTRSAPAKAPAKAPSAVVPVQQGTLQPVLNSGKLSLDLTQQREIVEPEAALAAK